MIYETDNYNYYYYYYYSRCFYYISRLIVPETSIPNTRLRIADYFMKEISKIKDSEYPKFTGYKCIKCYILSEQYTRSATNKAIIIWGSHRVGYNIGSALAVQ